MADLTQTNNVIAEYIFFDAKDGSEFFIVITVDRKPYGTLGPFASEEERQRVLDDFLAKTRELGAIDLPAHKQ
jgi:hypothetical protein